MSGHRKNSGVLCISGPPFACCARSATAFRQRFCIAYATRGPSGASNVHGLHGFLSRRNDTPVRAAAAPTCARCALAPSPLPAAAPRRASALLVCTLSASAEHVWATKGFISSRVWNFGAPRGVVGPQRPPCCAQATLLPRAQCCSLPRLFFSVCARAAPAVNGFCFLGPSCISLCNCRAWRVEVGGGEF